MKIIDPVDVCILLYTAFCYLIFEGEGDVLVCHDWQGGVVSVGNQYTPSDTQPCVRCTCHNTGFPVMCKSVLCSPPPDCGMFEQVPGQCCHFNCVLSADVPPGGTKVNGTLLNNTPPNIHTRTYINLHI